MYDFSYCVNCITSLTFFEEPSITSSCNECVKFHLPSSSEVTLNVASPPHKQSNFLTSTVCNTTPLKLQPLQQTQQVGVIVTHAVYRCYSWSICIKLYLQWAAGELSSMLSPIRGCQHVRLWMWQIQLLNSSYSDSMSLFPAQRFRNRIWLQRSFKEPQWESAKESFSFITGPGQID